MNAKKFRACLFVDEKAGTPSEGHTTVYQAYTAMREWLSLYVASCDVITGLRPFQLSYRPFHLYLVDIGGYPDHVKHAFMVALGNIVRGRPSRLYLFWTNETWESFCATNPNLINHRTCVNCCDPDALEKIEKILLAINN